MGSFKPRVIFTRNQVTLNTAAGIAAPNSFHKFCVLLDCSATSDVSEMFPENERGYNRRDTFAGGEHLLKDTDGSVPVL